MICRRPSLIGLNPHPTQGSHRVHTAVRGGRLCLLLLAHSYMCQAVSSNMALSNKRCNKP